MTDSHDNQTLETVRALLAKAESSEFGPEAEAFTAKAQELMARHSIEMAMLDEAAGRAGGSSPTSVRLVVEQPYCEPKVQILGAAAHANHCEVIWTRRDRTATLFGFPADIDAVEVLYTSLLVQATRAMNAQGSQFDWSGRNRTRSFRRAFLMGYANRIGWRLREAARSTVDASDATGSGVALVLAQRDRRVAEAAQAAYPHAVSTRPTSSNLSGWFAGEEAADRADLELNRLAS